MHEGTLLLTTPGPREDVRDVLRGATLDGRTTRGGLDAVVLAAAGLNRLGLMAEVHQVLDPAVFPPSPGQGALGIQVRIGSQAARLLEQAGDPQVDACVRAERALLAELHGGCSVPVGAWGRVEPDGLLHHRNSDLPGRVGAGHRRRRRTGGRPREGGRVRRH
ncbi:hypothetical protein AB0901_23080 [Streptomyces roseifaciens]